MKRYVVFGGDVYYPSGGWNDYKVDFADRIQAISWAQGFLAAECLTSPL